MGVEKMLCPKCGKEMEIGILRSESFMGGVKWLARSDDKMNKLAIADPDLMGYVKIPGFGCNNCRVLVLNY